MTWGDWVNSKYNMDGFYVQTNNNMIYSSAGYDVRKNYTCVAPVDAIDVNGVYSVKTSGAVAPTSN